MSWHNLNTSHVNVQFTQTQVVFLVSFDLNTSHVNVQYKPPKNGRYTFINLNTSHVNVQSREISDKEKLYKLFKYISC